MVNVAASYARWWEALRARLVQHDLSPADRATVFSGTAARFQRLPT